RRACRPVRCRPRVEALEDRLAPSATILEYPIPTPNTRPDFIAAGPNGNVWFTETNRNALARITSARQVTELPPLAARVPPGNESFVFGPDGNIWLGLQTDIAEITPQGTLLHDYPIPSASPPGIPDTGLIITMGPDGNIWYAAPYTNDLIGRLTP